MWDLSGYLMNSIDCDSKSAESQGEYPLDSKSSSRQIPESKNGVDAAHEMPIMVRRYTNNYVPNSPVN